MKRNLILAATIITALLIGLWAYTRAFIEIDVAASASSSKVTYTLLNQETKKEYKETTSDTRFRKLVRSGPYQIKVVSSKGASYFKIIKTGNLFGTTTVTASLAEERQREFIGNNPDPCMNYANATLLSYSCSGFYTDLKIHVPSTQNVPTNVISPPGKIRRGYIEGVAPGQNQGATVFLRAYHDEITKSESPEQIHYARELDSDFQFESETELDTLKTNLYYSFYSDKEGHIAYSNDFSHIQTFTSSLEPSRSFTINNKTESQGLFPFFFDASGKDFIIAYTNNSEGEVADFHSGVDPSPGAENQTDKESAFADGLISPDVRNEVVLYKNGDKKRVRFDGFQYSSVLYCATNKLCLQSGESLFIYDISEKEPVLLHQIKEVVTSTSYAPNKLAVVTKSGVLKVDIEKMEGSLQYTFGGYLFCGIQKTQTSYLLCLIDNKSRKVALLIEQKTANADSIDKRILKLQELAEVNVASVYKNIIYVSPNFVPIEYNPKSEQNEYDPVKSKAIDKIIRNHAKKVGIDSSKYTLINPTLPQ